MDSKLTLKLDKSVIERAKQYAYKNKMSLSRLIEAYLDSITRQKSQDIEITPFVDSLSGIIELPENFDFKQDYKDYLNEKYK
jgi:Family of unknown function (DUF6364)